MKRAEYIHPVWALQGEDGARESKGGIYGHKNGVLLSKEVGGRDRVCNRIKVIHRQEMMVDLRLVVVVASMFLLQTTSLHLFKVPSCAAMKRTSLIKRFSGEENEAMSTLSNSYSEEIV